MLDHRHLAGGASSRSRELIKLAVRLQKMASSTAEDFDPVHAVNAGRVTDQTTDSGKKATGRIDRGKRIACRQRDDPFPMRVSERAGADKQRAGPASDEGCKGRLDLAVLVTSTMTIRWPTACAAASTSLRSASVSGVFAFTSTAIVAAVGTSWRSNSSRLAPSSPAKKLDVAARRIEAGDQAIPGLDRPRSQRLIGTVVVAAFAASAVLWLPVITAAWQLPPL